MSSTLINGLRLCARCKYNPCYTSIIKQSIQSIIIKSNENIEKNHDHPQQQQQQHQSSLKLIKNKFALIQSKSALSSAANNNLNFNSADSNQAVKQETFGIQEVLLFLSQNFAKSLEGNSNSIDNRVNFNNSNNNIQVYDVSGRSIFHDYIVVIIANSVRQMRYIGESLYKSAKTAGACANNPKILSIEGRNRSDWLLVDLGHIMIHCFNSQHKLQPSGLPKFTEQQLLDKQAQAEHIRKYNEKQAKLKRIAAKKAKKAEGKEELQEQENPLQAEQSYLEPVIEYVGDDELIHDSTLPPAVDRYNNPIPIKNLGSFNTKSNDLSTMESNEVLEDNADDNDNNNSTADTSSILSFHRHPVLENIQTQFSDLKVASQEYPNLKDYPHNQTTNNQTAINQ
jgi:ribosomal silencing factor RsfS